MAESPSTDNYRLGKGVVYFDRLLAGIFTGERDLGNAPEFNFTIATEKLEHYSSRGGLRAKDKEIISQLTPSVSFVLDEINIANLAMLTLGGVSEITQDAGGVSAEEVTVHLGLRSDLAFRSIGHWVLPYDDSAADNVIFVDGEVVTGAGGATGIVVSLAVGSTATTGSLNIARTNAIDFIDDEILTGGIAGLADVDSVTGGSAGISPVILVQDDADTITYVEGTDYEISTLLKDDVIGRIKFLDGGSVVEDEVVHVTYGHAAATYSKIQAFKVTEFVGQLRFVSDNPVGIQQEVTMWSVSLTAGGDTALIGDDWSTLSFTGEILKDEIGHPDSPYMDMIMA